MKEFTWPEGVRKGVQEGGVEDVLRSKLHGFASHNFILQLFEFKKLILIHLIRLSPPYIGDEVRRIESR